MMQNSFEQIPAVLSVVSKERANSTKRDHSSSYIERSSFINNLRNQQKKSEIEERDKADQRLENEISALNVSSQKELSDFLQKNFPNNTQANDIAQKYFNEQISLGFSVDKEYLLRSINKLTNNEHELSTADKIKAHKEQLSQQGKSPTEILQILISKYEKEEAVSTWVENWKSFLQLHELAENKPPTERQAIQNIIAKADFSNESAFTNSLSEIANSVEISSDTKLEISQKFKGENISSISAMDSALKQMKSKKTKIERAIKEKKSEKKSLVSEIETIENELENLPMDDPKREKLKTNLIMKKQVLEQTVTTIADLETEKPKEVSFTLRDGVSAKLNPDGSRCVEIGENKFTIQLPKNALFMGRKNMLSINLAFTYKILSQLGIETLFTPKLKNGEVPDKQQRLFGRRILNELGYKTDQILSQSNIYQLENDLGKLKQKGSNTTGMEDLEALGIWDISNQSVNGNQFNSCLHFIRENRERDIGFAELKEKMTH